MTDMVAITPAVGREIRDTIETVKRITGPGVSTSRLGVSFQPPQPRTTQRPAATVPFATFVVKVTTDGGSTGSQSTTCDFTYTVTTRNGAQLGTLMTPLVARTGNIEYKTPAAGDPALAYYDENSAVQLVDVLTERFADAEECTSPT